MSFSSKVVIVTGASSGIGAAVAEEFAKEGASVVLVARRPDALRQVAERCGTNTLIVEADVTNDEALARVVTSTIERFGKIDVLINNAGVAKFGSIADGKILDTFDVVMNTNLRAAVRLTTLATPHLATTRGCVVNVSAIGGTAAPKPPFHAYCVSKAALDHFTRGTALELAPLGVRVNVVSPGPVRTDIIAHSGFPTDWEAFAARTALGRVCEPTEVAHLILFLASDKAKGITGSNYVIDNGMLVKSNI